MPTTVASGTQTAIISTEHTLTTETTAAVYVLTVDTLNMINGDELTLKITTRVLTGGVNAQAFIANYTHIQADKIKISVPVASMFSIVFTLEQTAGTGRDFDWSVVTL